MLVAFPSWGDSLAIPWELAGIGRRGWKPFLSPDAVVLLSLWGKKGVGERALWFKC